MSDANDFQLQVKLLFFSGEKKPKNCCESVVEIFQQKFEKGISFNDGCFTGGNLGIRRGKGIQKSLGE